VLRFGFEQVALHRVEATVLAGNAASAALLHRAGFEREGVLRGRALHQGTFRDVHMFGLTRADWAAAPAATDSAARGGRT
jgi:ribosomal-protein-alanine N-acetyltransferase